MGWIYKLRVIRKQMVIEAMNIDEVTWEREHRVKREEGLGLALHFNNQVEKDKLAPDTKKE